MKKEKLAQIMGANKKLSGPPEKKEVAGVPIPFKGKKGKKSRK